MRKYASAEERTAKKQKTTVRHFGFTEKVYGLPCTVRTMLLWKRHHRNAIVCMSFSFTGRHSSGSSPNSASTYIYIYEHEAIQKTISEGAPKVRRVRKPYCCNWTCPTCHTVA